MRDSKQLEDEVWAGCIVVAAIFTVFVTGVFFAILFL